MHDRSYQICLHLEAWCLSLGGFRFALQSTASWASPTALATSPAAACNVCGMLHYQHVSSPDSPNCRGAEKRALSHCFHCGPPPGSRSRVMSLQPADPSDLPRQQTITMDGIISAVLSEIDTSLGPLTIVFFPVFPSFFTFFAFPVSLSFSLFIHLSPGLFWDCVRATSMSTGNLIMQKRSDRTVGWRIPI